MYRTDDARLDNTILLYRILAVALAIIAITLALVHCNIAAPILLLVAVFLFVYSQRKKRYYGITYSLGKNHLNNTGGLVIPYALISHTTYHPNVNAISIHFYRGRRVVINTLSPKHTKLFHDELVMRLHNWRRKNPTI